MYSTSAVCLFLGIMSCKCTVQPGGCFTRLYFRGNSGVCNKKRRCSTARWGSVKDNTLFLVLFLKKRKKKNQQKNKLNLKAITQRGFKREATSCTSISTDLSAQTFLRVIQVWLQGTNHRSIFYLFQSMCSFGSRVSSRPDRRGGEFVYLISSWRSRIIKTCSNCF